MENLAAALAGPGGRGRRGNTYDLYFLWSLERVGVIYGVDKIGATDWYEYASDVLVGAQNPDGSWGGAGRGGYGPDIETSFALLVLGRSNLARDLSARVQKDLNNTELRAGTGGGAVAAKPKPAPAPAPVPVEPSTRPAPAVVAEALTKPVVPAKPGGTTPGGVAAELFRATGANWSPALQKVRDAKGMENTSALLAVIPLLDGDRKNAARDALAERLCRMSATTLRGMLKADDAELRRAAVLACAMKDDKEHVPDLIAVLEDKDETVVKAVRAGLKSLTAQDFVTAAEWRAWLAKEK
ncbi:HEAT repeat domain-containing protein [Frigoriglobus tundricola]|uniref:HEAT repeat domain-containing protein n=1 Tax=Frigoriglobus tundricola TaxID=2774151 RepID=UPI00148EE424|nr:HEAT repeat domain-containing protein [Frigoriglobus tundricola]